MAKKNRFFPEGTRTDSIPCHDLLVILSCSNYKITETHALQTLAISHLPTVSSSTFLICVLTSETYLRMYFRRAPQGEHGEAGRCDTGDIRNGSVEGGETAVAEKLQQQQYYDLQMQLQINRRQQRHHRCLPTDYFLKLCLLWVLRSKRASRYATTSLFKLNKLSAACF